MDNHSNLVKIYLFVCEHYEKTLKYCVQRFSNNSKPRFTDQEIMTIMLYSIAYEERFTMRQAYDFTANHLRSWFPALPSYVVFTKRVNRLSEAFRQLLSISLENGKNHASDILLCDSMPIMFCSGKRRAKVVREISDKGFCSTKSIYYYGVKLHLLASRRPGTIPFPEQIIITPASESDLNVFSENWNSIPGKTTFADKAYIDSAMSRKMNQIDSQVLTPVKHPKGTPDLIKQRDKAADDLFSKIVSSVRQPIESLFSWLIEKAGIQCASKIRSTAGLYTHVFAKLAAICCKKYILN